MRFSSCLLNMAIFLLSIGLKAEDDSTMSIGERFHYETGFGDDGSKAVNPSWGENIPLYKEYPDATRIKLPHPADNNLSVEKAIAIRRSIRSFKEKPLSLNQISQILQSADGLTHDLNGLALRSAPSGGALNPIDIYLAVTSVDSLAPGLYHYRVSDSSLELIKTGAPGDSLLNAAFRQEVVKNGRVGLILTARFDRSTRKYSDRGYRYTYIEAGAICENISLQVVSLGLGTTVVGAFNDDALNRFLDIDGRSEAALLIMPIGYPE
nr:SagB/ThcOx family dehydrogenase [candidate division Zixibacteria bacterium]